jgi:sporulation protein YlmC with PRC-barrel domain
MPSSKEAMMKKFLLGVALGALTLSPALAQAPKTPDSNPPAAAQNAPSANQQTAGKPSVVTSQKPDQWLASKFKGTDVLGADDKKIGDVSDILFDKDGKIEAYVISVGGFLGMGAKEVALAPSSFEVVPGKNGNADQLKLSMNKDQIKQAQNFKAYQPPRPTTTGMGGGTPGGMKPLASTPPAKR